jgi:hypothetical protein
VGFVVDNVGFEQVLSEHIGFLANSNSIYHHHLGLLKQAKLWPVHQVDPDSSHSTNKEKTVHFM